MPHFSGRVDKEGRLYIPSNMRGIVSEPECFIVGNVIMVVEPNIEPADLQKFLDAIMVEYRIFRTAPST